MLCGIFNLIKGNPRYVAFTLYFLIPSKGLGPDYTWCTLTGVKLNNNRTQYSSPDIYRQCNQDTEPELH